MAAGWIVRVEVEAGKGELQPLHYAAAFRDVRDAMQAAQQAKDVVAPRPELGNKPPPIYSCTLIGALEDETVRRLGLQNGELWRL